jgi:hypothetical protein
MCCITLNALEATMATTQLMHDVSYETQSPWLPEQKAERAPLRMNWVVVTGDEGKRQLRMHWDVAANIDD